MPNDATSDDPEVENESDDHDLDQGVATVQWRVPHPKKGEAVPGFNMDYLPPKTHPPVHNWDLVFASFMFGKVNVDRRVECPS